ncbi:MAG: two-component system response regulator [Cellvibrionales bacterium TMED21]|jgi:two-component system cell cycle response regulator DivK|nr:two-component system response regulator [Halieaceae bacterium]OUT67462.1 MAG: two-component system response regulator [Cellvibrionales bacterium TMED21]|tara:strand:+ start:3619 stop:3996 length:378 start_codon:yes stop_codon:yes gene_type:complete
MSSHAILLVEDNEINRTMLTRRLKRAGLDVLIAEDGKQALAIMRSEQPALVLMDMTLPVLDGWTACEQARDDSAINSIPIIALTAHAMASDRERALAAGCREYQTKPIDFPGLLEKIYALLEEAR